VHPRQLAVLDSTVAQVVQTISVVHVVGPDGSAADVTLWPSDLTTQPADPAANALPTSSPLDALPSLPGSDPGSPASTSTTPEIILTADPPTQPADPAATAPATTPPLDALPSLSVSDPGGADGTTSSTAPADTGSSTDLTDTRSLTYSTDTGSWTDSATPSTSSSLELTSTSAPSSSQTYFPSLSGVFNSTICECPALLYRRHHVD
jgi:hypothetical protein